MAKMQSRERLMKRVILTAQALTLGLHSEELTLKETPGKDYYLIAKRERKGREEGGRKKGAGGYL